VLTVKLAAPLALVALALVPVQERVQPKGPPTFEEALKALDQAWKDKAYGAATTNVQHLANHIHVGRTEAIHAAWGDGPEGWEKQPCTVRKDIEKLAQAGQILGGLTGVFAQPCTCEFKEAGGRGRLEIQVHPHSPMAGPLAMAMNNPVMLGDDQELIKYGDDKAILETQREGERYSLQLILDGAHLVSATLRGGTDDFLLQVVNQKAVDAVEKAIGG
jgi:hypothetical protein